MSSKKPKQTELEGMPNPEIRQVAIRMCEIKDKYSEIRNEEKEVQDNLRKMMQKEKIKTFHFEDDDGVGRTVKLIPSGEKIAVVKDKQDKKEKEEPLPA